MLYNLVIKYDAHGVPLSSTYSMLLDIRLEDKTITRKIEREIFHKGNRKK